MEAQVLKPYYQDSAVTIYHGDCREVIPRVSGDMVFADPPFNVGKKYGKSSDDQRSDYKQWCAEWIKLCFECLSPVSSFYLMTLDRHLEWKLPLMSAHGVFVSLIKWKNHSASHDKRRFWATCQPIALYGKTHDYRFYTFAERRTDLFQRWKPWFTSQGQMTDYWDDIPFVYAGSINHEEAIMKDGTNSKEHPCQSPLRLHQRCISFSTEIGKYCG